MNQPDAPEPEAQPEPEAATARRRAAYVRLRMQRGGRSSTIRPASNAGGPQPNARSAVTARRFGGLGFGQIGSI